MPCRRQRSFVSAPASDSLSTPMICSSVNRFPFIELSFPKSMENSKPRSASFRGQGHRVLQRLGHDVRLLPPQHVKPYVLGNKTDRRDAEAILSARHRESIVPVPVKSIEQQSVVFLHRLRATWMKTRTSRLNVLRGILRELGVTI